MSRSRPIRVMIVEDSRTVRQFLRHLIDRDPRLEVAAAVGTAEEALRLLDRVAPDVISMDIRLPGMNGLEATERIMSHRPTPIVVISASVDTDDLKISLNALRAGALAVVEKPVGTSQGNYECLAERICTQLAIMSQVKVIRQRFNRYGRPATRPAPSRPAALAPRNGPLQILGVVASTGGPSALVHLLGTLPRDFALPIVLVQHIAASFHHGFVNWLSEISPFPVIDAEQGMQPQPGVMHVAPAECHLRVTHGGFQLEHSEPVCVHRPSGTVLFSSLAEAYGPQAIGVLLTGMGSDGAEGLRQMWEKGAYTIAEDESTAVVYGMPAAAVRLGAACESLPLPEIGPRIVQLIESGLPHVTTFSAR